MVYVRDVRQVQGQLSYTEQAHVDAMIYKWIVMQQLVREQMISMENYSLRQFQIRWNSMYHGSVW